MTPDDEADQLSADLIQARHERNQSVQRESDLLRERDEARAELAALRARIETRLVSAGPSEDGTFLMQLKSEIAPILGQVFVNACDEASAPNSLELHLSTQDGRRVLVTVQRMEGLTPVQQRQAAVKERDAAYAERDRLAAALLCLSAAAHSFRCTCLLTVDERHRDGCAIGSALHDARAALTPPASAHEFAAAAGPWPTGVLASSEPASGQPEAEAVCRGCDADGSGYMLTHTCAEKAYPDAEPKPGTVRETDRPLPSCDWGGCDEPSVKERWTGFKWLPVCDRCARSAWMAGRPKPAAEAAMCERCGGEGGRWNEYDQRLARWMVCLACSGTGKKGGAR